MNEFRKRLNRYGWQTFWFLFGVLLGLYMIGTL